MASERPKSWGNQSWLAQRTVGQTIAFCGLLGWAFRPRNFMKKPAEANKSGTEGATPSCLAKDRRHKPIVCPTSGLTGM
jgi:hypothetical protein